MNGYNKMGIFALGLEVSLILIMCCCCMLLILASVGGNLSTKNIKKSQKNRRTTRWGVNNPMQTRKNTSLK